MKVNTIIYYKKLGITNTIEVLMEFSKLSSPSLKELFVTEIEHLILSGKLSIGEKLPTERELAKQMSVSRGVVNAGMIELARKGFVSIEPRVGAVISDYNRFGTIETLIDILRFNGGVMRKVEMKSLLEIRLIIETLAIKLAVPRIEINELNRLEELLDIFKYSNTPMSSAQNIFNFHHELCILSGNTILPIVFFSFKELAIRFWERYFMLHGKETLEKCTIKLFKCITERDVDGATKIYESSMNKTIEGSVSIYPE